jgi:uncharacterized protein YceK
MIVHTRILVTALVGTLALSACASARSTNETSSGRATAPTMLAGARPEWNLTGGPPATNMDLRVSVLVDAAGLPDMKTLTVTGPGAADNRIAVTEWIQQAKFRPAQQAGQPVSALYRTRIRMSVTSVQRTRE